jgi:putative DNA primase/helicase
VRVNTNIVDLEWGRIRDAQRVAPLSRSQYYNLIESGRLKSRRIGGARFNLDDAPTLFCFHNSCRGIVDGTNHELRSRIGKAEHATGPDTEAVADSANDATITRLADLPLLEYERVRKDEAKKLGVRASLLDKLVSAERPRETHGLQGGAVKLPDIEPWPETVNGAGVLDHVAEAFSHYVTLPDGAADALALWSAHTHSFRAFQCSPRLNISSPEKSCGKTTCRDVVALFVPRPLLTENMTTAVLFPLADSQSPTILADEYDAWLRENEELRGLFNSGHRQGTMVFRCEGDNNEVRGFAAYAPAVLCGIGALPATLHDRSIVIRLERAKRGELQARFDSRHTEAEQEHCRKLVRWCADNRAQLEECDPPLPDGAFNRVADNWRPLFAIAEVAGGDWPQRCAHAFAKLTSNDADADSLRMMLLADIRQVFASERMFSKDLIDALAEMKERPWCEVNHGKPITPRWLARNLADFGIRSANISIDEKQAKGYERAQFDEAFSRYLPETGNLSVPPSTTEVKRPKSIRPEDDVRTDEKTGFQEAYRRMDACETPKAAKHANADPLADPIIREAIEIFNAKIVTT